MVVSLMTVAGGAEVEAPVPAGAGVTVVAALVEVEEALTVLEVRAIVDELDVTEEDEEVATEVLEVTGGTVVTELEVEVDVEAVAVACEALERMLEASSGVRVVVTVATVAKTDGRTVTVTVAGAEVVIVVVAAVEVAVSVLLPVLVASPPAGSVEFPASPRTPPVAPLASMTEAALASLVQARRTPSSRMEGMAKQLSFREHLPRTVSHLLSTHTEIESPMQAESPVVQASALLTVLKRALSLWASWPFFKRVSSSRVEPTGAAETRVVEIAEKARKRVPRYCILDWKIANVICNRLDMDEAAKSSPGSRY